MNETPECIKTGVHALALLKGIIPQTEDELKYVRLHPLEAKGRTSRDIEAVLSGRIAGAFPITVSKQVRDAIQEKVSETFARIPSAEALSNLDDDITGIILESVINCACAEAKV